MAGQALLLVDHGSRQPEANAVLDEVAALVRGLRPGLTVHVAHMSMAQPDIGQGFEQCVRDGATEVIVHPYMLGPGRHAQTDIPAQVAACAARHPGVTFRITPPLGVHRKLGEIILDRAGLA
jgi:sirohydrochlorin ferrochelatase